MEDTRLPKCVVFGDGGECEMCGWSEKIVDGVIPGRPQSFRHQRRPKWTTAAQDEGEWRRTVEQGAEHFMAKWTAAEKARTGLRHAVVYSNATGRTKERVAQSKRVRAGSLALVD